MRSLHPELSQHFSHIAHRGSGPSHGAGDLGTSDASEIRDIDLFDAPVRVRGTHDHLEGPTRASVGHAEAQEFRAASRAHRSEVAQRQSQRSSEATGEVAIRQSGVDGPGTSLGDPCSHHQVGVAGRDRLGDADEVSRIERPVGVHEAHHLGRGRMQAGPARRAEASLGRIDDQRAELPRDPTRPIGAAVVDDDRVESSGHSTEQVGEGSGLVEHGEHDVGHGGGRYHDDSEVTAPASGSGRQWALLAATVTVAAVTAAAAFEGTRVLDPLTGINAPPFYGTWDAAIGWSVMAPIAVAAGVLLAARGRYDVSWHWVMLGSAVAVVAWSVSLGLADNAARLTEQLRSTPDYARGLDAVGNHPGNYLATFAERARGPHSVVVARGYPVHVQGHPPGAVLTLWGLTRLGFDPIVGGAVLVWSGMAASILAVLASVRRLAGELAARAAAPFLVLLPAAVWSHTFDTYFAGVGAFAVMASVFAIVPTASRTASGTAARGGPSLRWAVLSGLLFGYLALLSYGLVLLALVPVSVAIARRRIWTLPVTGAAALGVMAMPALWGFSWFDGLATTHHQYVTTVASIRPYRYFVWSNLAVAACAIGPAVLAGILLVVRPAWRRKKAWWMGAGPLVVGGASALLVADVTGLAKSEVERIFQPFYVWIAVAGVALAASVGAVRRDRVEAIALVLQVAVAVAFTTQLRSPW